MPETLVMGNRLRSAALAAFAIGAAAWVQAAALGVADAFKPATIFAMRLAPGGQHVLAFGRDGEAPAAIVMDVKTFTPTVLRSSLGGIPWTARWLGKDLILVAMRAETRIFHADGKLLTSVGGRFITTLPADADGRERFLVAEDFGGAGLERIDARTGRSTRIRFDPPDGKLGRWLTDRDGVPRLMTTFSDDETTLTRWYRASSGSAWQSIESSATLDARWEPLALARDGRSMIVRSAEGRDTQALFRYSLEERALQEMLAGHPEEDIRGAEEGIDADEAEAASPAESGGFIRVVTEGMKAKIHWFDARWSALQKSVDAALPGRLNWLSGNVSGTVLVHSSGDVDPGTWYVLDVASMSLREVAAQKPEIDRAAMRPTQVVTFPSLDGTRIPAYLTLPAGPQRDLPAVVLVHGGPVHRDHWAFSPEVQMLATRGYAVLQPQFRGSNGFGKRFEEMGRGQWGLAMQDDVTAGAQWLAAQGIADPRLLCIYGASYGGYAAMWALVRTPTLFRCGASFAGVSDLSLMFDDGSDVNDSAVGRLLRRRQIGDPATDRGRFDSVSPLRSAAAVQSPVFLAHGSFDIRVPIVHANKLLAALRAEGKSVDWLRLYAAEHGFGRLGDQEQFYTALFGFLDKHTAPPAGVIAAPRP